MKVAASMMVLLSTALIAGNDLIFFDGFDLTENEIHCPVSEPLISEINELGGSYYIGNGIVDFPGKKNFFNVNLDLLEWYHFEVIIESGNILHPVISLFSDDGSQLIAQNASSSIRDALFSHRNVSSGNYCLKIEDYSTFANQKPRGGEYFNYQVNVIPIDFSIYDDFNVDIEPNNNIDEAQASISFLESSSTKILGTLNEESDKDFYKLTMGLDDSYLTIIVNPVGSTGNGSTSDLMEINLIDTNQVDTLARVDPQFGVRSIYYPVIPNNEYYVEVSKPELENSDNAFYVLDLQKGTTSRQEEVDDINNNSWVNSEVAINNPLNISPAPSFNYFFIAGELSGMSDQDWWQLDVQYFDELSIDCRSAYSGSGNINALFEIYNDPDLTPLQSEVENPLTGVIWSNNPPATMETVPIGMESEQYLKVSANMFSTEVVGRHYRCLIQAY